MKRLTAVLGAAVTAAVLAGCSTGATEATDTPEAQSTVDEGAFPVTIEHAFGETTIREEPRRVATLGWSDQDHVAALGVVPVGAVKITWGGNDNDSSDWFDAAVADLGGEAPVRYDDADGAPVGEIAKLQPDLILATNSGITEKEYQKLSKIAPVVAYPEAPWTTPWQTSLEMVGQALGRSEQAEELQVETEKQIEAAREEYPEIVGKSLVFGYLTTTDLSQIGVYAPQDPRVSFMHDLGLEDAEAVDGVIEKGEFYGQLSAERASELESDVFLTWSEKPGDMKKVTEHDLIGKVPAIESGHAYAEADQEVAYAVTNPNPLSIPVIIEEFVPHVAEAVEGK